ncbi:MAG: DUF4129 domain-containing protein [Micromonosporaceae bacterium]
MRWWNEFVANVADHVPGGVPTLGLILLAVAALSSLLLATWPAWLPWRWRLGRLGRLRFRLRRPTWRRLGRIGLRWRWRLRWGRRSRRKAGGDAELADDQLPELPAAVLALTADELAAAGRFAEAVRERLRAIVRGLIEGDVIPHTPGWTVTELSRAAGQARPDLASPLSAAGEVFSEIWYALRPARLDDDTAMRAYAEQIGQTLADSSMAGAR